MALTTDRLNFMIGMDTTAMAGGKRSVLLAFKQMSFGAKAVVVGIAAIGIASIVAMAKAVKAASRFRDAFNEVRTLVDETQTDTKALSREVLILAAAVGRAPEEVSGGLYQVISAGVTDAADAMFVLEIATKASIAGLTDSFTAVDAITTVLNAYNLKIVETEHVSDLMFNAVKEGKLTFGDLASNIGTVASSAALAGVSFEEVTAALATMTKAGQSTEEATTALNQLLLQSIKIDGDAAAAAKKYGVEISATALKTIGLSGVLKSLNKGIGGSIEKMIEILPNIRAFRGGAILAGTGFDEFNRILGTTENVTGDANRAFLKIKESASEMAKEIKARVSVALIELGNTVLPSIIDGLKEMVDLFDRLTKTEIDLLLVKFKKLGAGINEVARATAVRDQIIALRTLQELEAERLLIGTLALQTLIRTEAQRVKNAEMGISVLVASETHLRLARAKTITEVINAGKTEEEILEVITSKRESLIRAVEHQINISRTGAKLEKEAAEFIVKRIEREIEGLVRVKDNIEATRKANELLAASEKLLGASIRETAQLNEEAFEAYEKRIKLGVRVIKEREKELDIVKETVVKIIERQKVELKLNELSRREGKLTAEEAMKNAESIARSASQQLDAVLRLARESFGEESMIVKQLLVLIKTINLEIGKKIDKEISVSVVLNNINSASASIQNLGKAFGFMTDQSRELLRVGTSAMTGIVSAIASPDPVSQIIGATAAFTGLVLAVSSANDATEDWIETVNDIGRAMSFWDIQRGFLDLEGAGLSADRSVALLSLIRRMIADLRSRGLTPDTVLTDFQNLLESTDFTNEEMVRALNNFIRANAEALTTFISDAEVDNIKGVDEFKTLIQTFETGIDQLLEELIAIREALEEGREDKFKDLSLQELRQKLFDLGVSPQALAATRTREELLALLDDKLLISLLGEHFEDALAVLLAILGVLEDQEPIPEVGREVAIRREKNITRRIPVDLRDIKGVTSVRQFIGITELQGNALLGTLNTSRIIQQQMLDLWRGAIGDIGIVGGNFDIDIEINNPVITSGQDVSDLAETLGEELRTEIRAVGVR